MSKRLGPLPELEGLLSSCKTAETKLNDDIFNSLVTLKPDIFKKKFSTHGYYIKKLLTGFNDVSSYEEISGDVNSDKLMEKMLASISKDPNVLINLGLGALYSDFKRNIRDKNLNFAQGNLDEAKRYVGLSKMLEQSFPGASIKDTAPKDFGASVLYDMQIEFPLDFTNKIAGMMHINIENKTGVTNSAATSSFHFGTVSNQAITGGDLVYKSFLNQIQDISRKYLLGLSFHESVESLKLAQEDYMRKLTIEYIKWRLANNFPVYTSSAKDGVVLCSEVLAQMGKNDMTSLGEDSIGPGEKILRYYDSRKFTDRSTIYEERTFKNIKNTGIDSIYRSIKSVPEASTTINKLIEQGKNVSPSFKISVWYGKK